MSPTRSLARGEVVFPCQRRTGTFAGVAEKKAAATWLDRLVLGQHLETPRLSKPAVVRWGDDRHEEASA